MAEEEELDEVVAYTRYEVDCPSCGVSMSLESDPQGDTVECDGCGVEFRVRETL